MSDGLVSEPETDLIEAIRNGLPPGVEFDEREETLLSLAAQQARDVQRAEADLEVSEKRGWKWCLVHAYSQETIADV
jgi:hypothetical protein